MSPYSHLPDDELSDAERGEKRRVTYERVIKIVDAQTSPMQPPLAARTSIQQIISMSSLDNGQADKALAAAVDNGDLIEWSGRYALTTRDSLLRVIESEVESDSPRKLLIGKCNRILAEKRAAADREAADGGGE